MTLLEGVTLAYAALLLAGLWGAGAWWDRQHAPK